MSAKEKKKLDTGVLIAIIGLVGTLIAAALSSPLLVKLIERTPTPNATEPATPDLPGGIPTLVFNEDFEDGAANGFAILSGDWQVRKTAGSSYYEAEGSSAQYPGAQAVFGPSDLSDGSVQFQVNLPQAGEFYLVLRDRPEADYLLVLDSGANAALLVYSDAASGWAWTKLAERSFTFGRNDWYTVEVNLVGPQITVSIDGSLLLSAADERVVSGGLSLILTPGMSARIDNLAVWSAGN